jgi:hypothetical protein
MIKTIPSIMKPEASSHLNQSLSMGVILSVTESNRQTLRMIILTADKPELG